MGDGVVSGGNRGNIPALISTLASLGLEAMDGLLSGDDDCRRLRLYRAYTATGGQDLVQNLFAGAHGHAQGLEPEVPPPWANENDPQFAPPAYLYYQESELAVVDDGIYTLFWDLQYNLLGERAYVFWDAWRVERLGVPWDIDELEEMEGEFQEGAGRFSLLRVFRRG